MTTAIVIAKEPVAGRVKTRLCPPCTPDEAAAIAAAALRTTLEVVLNAQFDRRVVAFDGDPNGWIPPGFDIIAQRGGGLDERLAHAFADVVETQHQNAPIVLIGMDTPHVTIEHLADTNRLLDTHDAVLGLTPDGGWWCIGLHAPDPNVFLGVPMSQPDTGERQLERLHELHLATALHAQLRDVDYFDDAVAVAAHLPTSEFARLVQRVDTRATAGGRKGPMLR